MEVKRRLGILATEYVDFTNDILQKYSFFKDGSFVKLFIERIKVSFLSSISRVLVCVCACVRSHACVRKSRCEGGAKPHGFVRAMCVRAGVFWASHTCAIAPEIFQTFFLILLKKFFFQTKIEKKNFKPEIFRGLQTFF